ncbi:MAG: hypothetical protein ABH881_00315 [bacterium]
MEEARQKKYVWTLIIAVALFLSIFFSIKIYQIKDLFLNSSVRTNAIEANMALREIYGLAATDLSLRKIEKRDKRDIFYFDYYYHGSEKEFFVAEKKFKVEFEENKFVMIESL